MSQRDILPWGTEQGGEGGEWSEVDNNQKSTINTRMEEPVLWAKSGGNVKEKRWGPDQWEKSEVPKDRTLNWVLDVEYELSDGRAAC